MATSTNIEWTDKTWNPVAGCKKVSPGCAHCYAETMAKRLAAMGQKVYTQVVNEHGWNGKFIELPERLAEPLRWKSPRTVFVNSMSDLFGEGVSFEFIAAVFGVMAACPQHTFQILTKRPERAVEFFEWINQGMIEKPAVRTCTFAAAKVVREAFAAHCGPGARGEVPWPLTNVWLGVSVENQEAADLRIPLLLQTPAAVRFISAEPLIGPVDLRPRQTPNDCLICGRGPKMMHVGHEYNKRGLDWVIVGGESGSRDVRQCEIEWIRNIVSQCRHAGVPCFVKQVGSNPHGHGQWVHEDNEGRGVTPELSPLKDRKGGDPAEWPEDLRVREFPAQAVRS